MSKWWLIVGAAMLGVSGPSFAQTPPPQAQGYHLVFGDDFKNFDLSPDGRGNHTWYEGIWFSKNHAPPENIRRTPDGLELTWTRGQQEPDTSISTFSRYGVTSHAWRYGYFEVRMKWKPVPGAWPAIWLIPNVAGHLQESGEMDIFEGVGEMPNVFNGTLHDWQEDPGNPNKMDDVRNTGKTARFSYPRGTNLEVFHTYGMLWEPNKITWYFDDKPLHSESAYPIFSQQDYALIIGMQEGTDWKAGNLDRVSAQRMDMDIQAVRVWQK